jgi:hypothetical protein
MKPIRPVDVERLDWELENTLKVCLEAIKDPSAQRIEIQHYVEKALQNIEMRKSF